MFEPVHVERVIRHLVRFGSSRADAEDLAQEALVIAWRKQGELDRDRSLDAWLYGIARNVYRNHTRTLRRRAEDPGDDRDAVADARELADSVALREALQALPENQQDIVILHELEEYTLKETAELLAIPFDTAKDRLRRAREGMRERMHVDLAAATASERRTTGRLAKAAAPAVLAGVLAAVSRTAAAAVGTAGGGASGTAGGGASGTAGAGAAPASTGAVLATSALPAKLVVAGVLAVGIVAGVVVDRVISSRPSEAASPAQIAAPSPPAPEPSMPDAAAPDATVGANDMAVTPDATGGARDVAVAPDTTAVARVVDAKPDVAVAEPAPPPSAPVKNIEAELVTDARRALRGGDPGGAVRTLMAHERRFPAGQLAEERDVLLVEAYLASGNIRLATDRLQHYRATYPSGLHRQRADDAAREIERRRAGMP